MSELAAGLAEVVAATAPTFEPVAPFRWLSDVRAPVRTFYEFQPMKGGVYSVRWGFDLAFSPWLTGQRLVWKRTAKQAKMDLAIDPIDVSGRVDPWHSINVNERDRRAMARVVAATWERAADDFAGVGAAADLVDLFERRSSMTFRRFSLGNYITADLCWGLALHGIGRAAPAQQKISAFCDRFELAPNDRVLNLAIGEARAHYENL